MKSHLKRCISAFIQQPRQKLDSLMLYLEGGGDINREYKGTTVLCEAARCGCEEAVHEILRAGAEVDHADMKGCTPLYLASSHGHTDVVRALLQAGANVDSTSLTNYTPLATAIQNNHDDCANLLIDSGASVNVLRPNISNIRLDISLLSYVLFAKGDTTMATKLLKAGTLPHEFMPPLGFILLDDPITPLEFVRALVYAGFTVYHESWIQIKRRRGDCITEVQSQLLELLEHEHKNAPSLQRLCRVNIRTALVMSAQKGHLRTKIENLPLPVNVRKYLAMDYL